MKVSRVRQYFTMMVIVALIFSSLSYPSIGFATTSNEAVTEQGHYFQTSEDVPMFMEDDDSSKIVGELLAGHQFPVNRVEGDKLFFILHEELEVYILADSVEWLDELTTDESLLIQAESLIGEEVLKENTEVLNQNGETIFVLKTDVAFPIIANTYDYLVIKVGPYLGKVMTVNEGSEEELIVLEEELESPQEELVEETNSEHEQKLSTVEETTSDNFNNIEETEEEVEEVQTVEPAVQSAVQPTAQPETVEPFTSTTKYFEVMNDNIPVYDNSTGSLVEVGWLKKGEVYPRVRDYGSNWHEIRYGNGMAYVRKADTIPATGESVKNKNTSYQNSNRLVVPQRNIDVFDNSSGQLVSFAHLKEGRSYPIVGDFGPNWHRVLLSDRVGYIRTSEVTVNQQVRAQSFTSSTRYFEVINDNIPVYDNSTGSLVEVGWLKKGEVYPRVRDFGPNWHEIRYGNGLAYVRKADTVPSNGSALRNENTSFQNSSRSFVPRSNVEVYDNTSGQLVPYGVLRQGRSYPIVGNFGANWYRVLLSDRVGFVRTSEVNVAFNSSDRYFQVLQDGIEVYDNSSGSLVKIGELSKGQVYPRIRDFGANWHEIEFGGRKAYVRKAGTQPATNSSLRNENRTFQHSNVNVRALGDIEVYDNSSGSLVPFATILNGKSFRIVGNFGANWYRVVIADRVGFVRVDETALTFTASHKYFEVLRDNVEVFDNSTGSLVKVGELTKGQVYPRVRDFGNWHEIQFGNGVGYVRKSSTRPPHRNNLKNENTSFRNSRETVVPTENIEVYDNTSGRLVPFATLLAGERYPVVGTFGSNWYRVLVSDRVGFIRSSEVVGGKNVTVRNQQYNRTLEEVLDIQMTRSPQTDLYRNLPAFVHKDHVQLDTNSTTRGTVTASSLNVREAANATSWRYGTLSEGTRVTIVGQSGDWYQINFSAWRNAKRADVAKYLDPDPNKNDIFQHLVLSSSANVPVSDLNKLLEGKGILEGRGSAFSEASKRYNINEIYLIAHALLETGHGRSQLATGITVEGRTVHNMYGTGAFDSCPYTCGSQYAYNAGWFTPDLAIIGGAEFVARNYFGRGQNTLYKMRWNPQSPGTFQYATDIQWAVKQVNIIKNLYNQLDSYTIYFDVVSYD
ncbi:N-acetylglucosaminidase [Alkalihalobacterium sp. APHAB7]|uniref:N-acetylglucosaminidase n=1 Tax=Alkalihalobacterium sp. APHAB7 TaxID=3402081 RepID=UPI003AAB3623